MPRFNYAAGQQVRIPDREWLIDNGWRVVGGQEGSLIYIGSDGTYDSRVDDSLTGVMGTIENVDADEIFVDSWSIRPEHLGLDPVREVTDVEQIPRTDPEIARAALDSPAYQFYVSGDVPIYDVPRPSRQLITIPTLSQLTFLGWTIHECDGRNCPRYGYLTHDDWSSCIHPSECGTTFTLEGRYIILRSGQEIPIEQIEEICRQVKEASVTARVNNEAIRKLAETSSAIDAARQGLIKCGFELEFHKLNGVSAGYDDDGEIDHDALRDAANEAFDDADFDDLNEYMDSAYSELFAEIHRHTGQPHGDIYQTFRDNKTLFRKLERAVADMEESWRSDWEENCDMDQFRSSAPDVYNDFDCNFKREIDCGSDASVRGGEIRTVGGKSPARFMAIVSDIFKQNTFEIDHGCSFHIHLSVPGVMHKYGPDMQAEMMAYLFDQYHRWPLAVRKRFTTSSCERYFAPQLDRDKYSMIHFSSHCKTWEFRFFGNVSNARDARHCLILAIEAIRHAYRVKSKLSNSLIRHIPVLLTVAKHLRREAILSVNPSIAFSALSKIERKNYHEGAESRKVYQPDEASVAA